MGHTLSQIWAWDVDHLIEAADYWTVTADRWESAFAEVHQQAHAVAWEGAGATAMRDRVTVDKAYAASKADRLREAASVARRGAGDIAEGQRRVLYVVEDAQKAEFNVHEDLSVTDKLNVRNRAERAARQALARAFAAEIRQRVVELAALDAEVATNITAAAGDVDNFADISVYHNFNENGRIQLVDDHHHKCEDDQKDIERKIAGAAIGGFMIGGVGGAVGGPPGAIGGGLIGGASAGILAGIDEAITGGERFSGCE